MDLKRQRAFFKTEEMDDVVFEVFEDGQAVICLYLDEESEKLTDLIRVAPIP